MASQNEWNIMYIAFRVLETVISLVCSQLLRIRNSSELAKLMKY